jgi:hypothetical protein
MKNYHIKQWYNMFSWSSETYAYLRASTKEQNADRAKGSLQQFASEHDLVIFI